MKKVLVTGGAGFIGSNVVKELATRGVDITVMIRPGENTKNIDGLDIKIVSGDILDKQFVNDSVKGHDTVFHLAAVYATWMPDFRPLYEVNLQGSRNVLWACKESADVKRVVYTSSMAAIGVAPGKQAANESTEFNQYKANPYVVTKYLSQQEALGFAEHGLDLVVVNPAFPFGPGDIAPTPTGKIILNMVKGMNRFKFDGGFNAVDVRDVAKGHVLAAEKGKAGDRYILSNRNVTIEEFAHLVAEVQQIDLKMLPFPSSIMKGLSIASTWLSDNVTHKPPLATPSEVEYGAQYLFLDNTKAQKELGFEPRDIRESIRDSIAWFKSNGYLK